MSTIDCPVSRLCHCLSIWSSLSRIDRMFSSLNVGVLILDWVHAASRTPRKVSISEGLLHNSASKHSTSRSAHSSSIISGLGLLARLELECPPDFARFATSAGSAPLATRPQKAFVNGIVRCSPLNWKAYGCPCSVGSPHIDLISLNPLCDLYIHTYMLT